MRTGAAGLAHVDYVNGAIPAALTDVVDALLWSALEGEQLVLETRTRGRRPSIYERAKRAAEVAIIERDQDRLVARIAAEIGTGSCGRSASRFPRLLRRRCGRPWCTVRAAANASDDIDTVACMAGSIAGVFSGFVAVPRYKYAQVLEANPIDIADVAKRLYETVR